MMRTGPKLNMGTLLTLKGHRHPFFQSPSEFCLLWSASASPRVGSGYSSAPKLCPTSRSFRVGIRTELCCGWRPLVRSSGLRSHQISALTLHRGQLESLNHGANFASRRVRPRSLLQHVRAKSEGALAAAQSVRAGGGNSSRSGSERIWDRGLLSNSAADEATADTGQRWTHSIVADPHHAETSADVASIQHDFGVLIIVMASAFLWVRMFDFFTSKGVFEQKLSRKMIHITSGLIFMLTWPLFSSSKWAPLFAGVAPLTNGLRLLVSGLGYGENKGFVKSMSRSGEPRELLRGPLYYVVVLFVSTVLFWRTSPVGMVSLSMMCGGDGIADIMGRKFGSKRLPYNKEKSFAGSISMFLFGFLLSLLFVYYFTALGFFKVDPYSAAGRLALISLVSTAVESLPITKRLDDNFTVPACAFAMGVLLFPST